VTFLLDTNTCIAVLSARQPRVAERMRSYRPADLCLCSVVKAELSFGALKSARAAVNLSRLEVFFGLLVSLPFDDRAAEHAARVRLALERRGTPIGPNDLLIAATALAHGLTLVTHNTREFSRVDGLQIQDWESE
jgi:tRNA(fMet)-specific endonuclease VapC